MSLRLAWRSILRMPLLAGVVVVSLGVGIGVNTAVFSWIEAVVLRPLPGVANSAQFHLIEPRAETGSYPGVSWLEFLDLRERLRMIPDPIVLRMAPFNVGEPGETHRALGALVSGNYFSALGLRPALGRFIRPDEVTQPGGAPVVVISHDYWRAHMNGARSVVGQNIRVNDRIVTIVGVTPPKFQGTHLGLNFEMWAPATMAPALVAGSRELEDRSLRGYQAMGRLASGASIEQAQADLDRAMRDLAQAYPESNRRMQAEVLPFWKAPRGPQRMLASALFVLQGIMLLLLLAVCGNTANLMLARASSRHREMGMRLALGAGPGRIAALLLTENVLLGLVGAALGVAIAIWATDALRAVPFIGAFPIKFQTAVDGPGLGFAAALGVSCGVVFGIVPALQLSRVDPHAALRSGSRTAGRSALRNTLMGVEAALALVVLMAAGLFVRSFSESRDADPGFRREGLLLTAYDLGGKNMKWPEIRDFTGRLLDRLRKIPNVDGAAVATSVPLDIHGLPIRAFTLEGRPQNDADPDQALSNTVTPDYFKTMGIAFVAGRDFVDLRDTAAPAQAIVNDEFVRRFVRGRAEEALGRRVTARGIAFTIVGVVRTSVSDAFGEPATPVLYLSFRDRPSERGEIHVRTRVGAETLLAPAIERVVRDLDPMLPVFDVRTMNEHVDKNLFLRKIPARMFAVLGPMLLLLAAIGIYAVVAYTVSLRTREIGVRLALGATSRRVVRQIVGETLRVIGAGALVGWALALMIDLHLVRGVIYLSVFVGVPAILIGVAMAASWVPSRRAATVDPNIALRQE